MTVSIKSTFVQNELVNTLVWMHSELAKINANTALIITKAKMNDLLKSGILDSDAAASVEDIFDKCLTLWHPLCEKSLITYQKIQRYLVPELFDFLSTEYKTIFKKRIKEGNIVLFDFLKATDLEKIKKEKESLNEHFDYLEDDTTSSNIDNNADAPYCCACEQRPCMCSDREKTSLTLGW